MAFQKFGWSQDPFVLKIDPKLFVGYEEQVKAILKHLDSRHKIAVLVGSTGAGKSHLLKWLEQEHDIKDCAKLYIAKPPLKPEEFVGIFTDIFGVSFLHKLTGRKPTLYNLPKYINGKLKGAHLLLMVDEAHETNKEVLEWLRVLVDQIDSVSLILSGLPVLEQNVRDQLQTLDQRITARITLTALSKEATKTLIQMRIESVGGTGIKPFTDSAIDSIYNRTGGFPREVLKMCDKLVNDAMEKNQDAIEAANIEEYKEFPQESPLDEQVVAFSPKPPNEDQIANLPYKQKQILEALAKTDWLTPTDIVEQTGDEGYATKGHAVRSINNVLHRLMMDGFVQRESRGKAFMYALTPKVKTVFVKQ